MAGFGIPSRQGIAEWAKHSWWALSRHWRRMAVFFVPWLIVIAIGFPLLWYQIEEDARGALLAKRDNALIQANDVLGRTLDRLGRDALFLADITARLPGGDLSRVSEIGQVYLAFSDSAPDYDQVRWLDTSGMERIRVNRRGGPARFIPTGELQSKADRRYFTESVSLQQDAVYFSELDLNVEQGKVEQPIQPMVRVASPVYVGEARRGVVIINYRAQRLLERLDRVAGDVDLYLVNPAGYWIQGPDPEDEWAWQLGKTDRRVQAQNGEMWQALRSGERGEWQDGTGYWAFRHFVGGAGLMTSGDATAVSADDLGITLVAHVDSSAVASREANGKAILLVLVLALALMTLAVAIRIARSLESEAAHTRALQEANDALSVTNSRLQLTQKELARAERLSSLGLMVAGVAHELNTPIGSATLTLSKAKQDLDGLEARLASGLRRSDLDAYIADSGASLGLAQDAIKRSTMLIQQFKQVAVDRATLHRRSIDLAEFIREADPRLHRWQPADPISLRLHLAPKLRLLTYPGPLAQVLTNLLTNALSHAFAPGEPGTVTLTTRADGPEYVTITITDDGKGIPEDDIGRIFEPFFTTARGSGGTGLGLHIVHQIVTELLGGTISVTSTTAGAGKTGTTFRMRLPRTAPAEAESEERAEQDERVLQY